MDKPDITVARLAVGGHGMLHRSQALDDGLTSKEYRARKEDGLLIPVHRGITRHAAVPLTWRGRLAAAVLAGGDGAVASHRSAARLHDFDGVPRFRPEVTTCAVDLPRAAGVQFHRTNLLDPLDIVVVDHIRATARPRTLHDLGAVLPFDLLAPIVEDAVIRKLVTRIQLIALLERVGGRGRRGSASLRAALETDLPEHLESDLERRLWRLLPPGHGMVTQHELTCTDGRRVRLDMADPARKIAIEANGRKWHGTTKAARADMARRRSIQASGWHHYEYGWSEVTEAPTTTRLELAAILA
jgi:hypothetical protein